MTKTTLTTERLRELLSYCPATGTFTWRDTRGPKARAGDIAGTIGPNRDGKLYRRVMVDQRLYLAHRLAVLWMTGAMPEHEVDHKDGDGLNNRWRNLRVATRAENNANCARHRDNRSGFKGVQQRGHRFAAWHCSTYLGTYDTPLAAHVAYVAAAERHFGEFARAQ